MPDAVRHRPRRSPAGEIAELLLGYLAICAPWAWHVACVTATLHVGAFWLAAPLSLALGAVWIRGGGGGRALDAMVGINIVLVHATTLSGVVWFMAHGLAPAGWWAWALWLSLGSLALAFVWHRSQTRAHAV